jgi:hypothetical protein
MRVLVVFAFLVIVALLSVDIYVRVKPPKWASAPTPCPSPAPVATNTATPTASPWPTAVGAEGPAPRAGATAGEIVVQSPVRPEPTARPVAVAAVAPAPGAASPGPPKVPAGPRKPKVRPVPSSAPTPKADAATDVSSRKGFVAGDTTFATGETRVTTKETGSAEVPAGFDPGGVAVKAAPKIAARLEFDIQPKRLKSGDPYVVKVYLRNDGKKAIKVRELRVASALNGARSESALTPRLKEVPPQQVALLAEVPSVWKGDVKSWSMEVFVRSGHGDVYSNTVTWR